MASMDTTGGGASRAQWRLVLPPRTDTPARVRHALAGRLGTGPRTDDIAILLSEVVTNAVRHGGGPGRQEVVVEIARGERDLLVRVLDGGDGLPRRRTPGPDGGFGLHLVAALADDWGARPGEVWFRVGISPAAA